jgi:hypothetical protein
MQSMTNTQSGPSSSRQVLRRTLPAPLLALLAACGGRYEVGETVPPLDRDNPVAVEAIGKVLVDDIADADAVLAAQTDMSRAGAVGDVNGDGYDDWIDRVAHPRGDRYDQRLYYGRPRQAGGVFEAGLGPSVSMPRAAPVSGWPSASPAGDVNGDGYADVLWSFRTTMGGDGGDNDALAWDEARGHRTYLLYGGENLGAGEVYVPEAGVTFAPLDAVLDSFAPERRLELDPAAKSYHAQQEIALVGIGDIDGDGFDDFTYTYWLSWEGIAASYPEVMLPVATQTPTRLEAVTYLFYGGPERLAGDGLPGRSAELLDVYRVSALGDVDGDGLAEFAAQMKGGQAFVIPGGRARLGGTIAAADIGRSVDAAANDGPETLFVFESTRTQGVGDLDGDGYADLAVTHFDDDITTTYLFYGGRHRLSQPFLADYAEAAFTAREAQGDATLQPLGDWNGDGTADLLVTVTKVRAAPEPGVAPDARVAAVVIPGSFERHSGMYTTTGIDPNLDLDDPARRRGVTGLPLGDIDGDGLPDLQLRAPGGGSEVKFGGSLAGPIY